LNKRNAVLLVWVLIAAAVMILNGCSPPTLVSIGASPQKIDIYDGYSKQLFVLATYSNGKQKDVSDISEYKSYDENKVTVNGSGFAVGTGVGETTISIAYTEGNVTANTTVPVAIETFGGTGTYSGMS
jgi:hypothetical protein